MIKRNEQEWQALFKQQAASGLSARKFCEANKLCAKYFCLRRKQLHSDKKSSPTFVPVTVNHVRGASATTGPALVFRHGNSALYFDAAPNPDWLAQLLRALV